MQEDIFSIPVERFSIVMWFFLRSTLLLLLSIFSPTIPTPPVFSGVMALPDTAYAALQKQSPILIKGSIQSVSKDYSVVTVRIIKIERNLSSIELLRDSEIHIHVDLPSLPESGDSFGDQKDGLIPPTPGMFKEKVVIPSINDTVDIWIRPTPREQIEVVNVPFQLLAGPYGFGPNLEDLLQE